MYLTKAISFNSFVYSKGCMQYPLEVAFRGHSSSQRCGICGILERSLFRRTVVSQWKKLDIRIILMMSSTWHEKISSTQMFLLSVQVSLWNKNAFLFQRSFLLIQRNTFFPGTDHLKEVKLLGHMSCWHAFYVVFVCTVAFNKWVPTSLGKHDVAVLVPNFR